jgi:hypothetical protein
VLALRRVDIYNTSIKKYINKRTQIVLITRADATPIALAFKIHKIILTFLKVYIKRFKYRSESCYDLKTTKFIILVAN